MTAADALAVRSKGKVITVNTSYRLAPWADVHYSSDHDWWLMHLPEIRETCSGELWSGYPHGRFAEGIKICPYDKQARGIIRARGRIAWGGNSGYCALGLAYQFGAKRIILLGYDMTDSKGEHWHGSHDESIRKAFNFPMWKPRFAEAARDFKRLGIEVVNCSRDTALDCFPKKPLEDVIC